MTRVIKNVVSRLIKEDVHVFSMDDVFMIRLGVLKSESILAYFLLFLEPAGNSPLLPEMSTSIKALINRQLNLNACLFTIDGFYVNDSTFASTPTTLHLDYFSRIFIRVKAFDGHPQTRSKSHIFNRVDTTTRFTLGPYQSPSPTTPLYLQSLTWHRA